MLHSVVLQSVALYRPYTRIHIIFIIKGVKGVQGVLKTICYGCTPHFESCAGVYKVREVYRWGVAKRMAFSPAWRCRIRPR